MQSTGQTSMHASQPVQLSARTTASSFGNFLRALPAPLAMTVTPSHLNRRAFATVFILATANSAVSRGGRIPAFPLAPCAADPYDVWGPQFRPAPAGARGTPIPSPMEGRAMQLLVALPLLAFFQADAKEAEQLFRAMEAKVQAAKALKLACKASAEIGNN